MNFDLEGKTAIITGGGRGLGRAYSLGFAEQGAKVGVVDVDPETAASVAAEIVAAGGTAIGVSADVSSGADVTAMVDRVAAELGGATILINNAAFFASLRLKPSTEIPEAEWDRVMSINVKGAWLCANACIPHMTDLGYGKILNVSSNTVWSGRPGYLHYVTSKMALIGMTRGLASEWGEQGIRVNTIVPGLIDTGVDRGTIDPERFQDIGSETPLRRIGRPDDLLDTALYLCSPASDFVTGQALVVDGGHYFH